MSPTDLGQVIKPFVFLDLFEVSREFMMQAMANLPLHPHSGIATITVPVEGGYRYHDPISGASGTINYGGLEWMRAGNGIWHGKELSASDAPRTQGFQLWLALPPELENSEPDGRFIEAEQTPQVGPARIITGLYEGAQSPVPAPQGINCLLITLRPGERWTYQPPAGHTVSWLALAKGQLEVGASIRTGELVVFEPGETPITLEASGSLDSVFLLASAVPHPHDLHLGNYSVHTSAQALEKGQRRIAELAQLMEEAGNRNTPSGTIPVFR
ncbi:pirin family protein [Pseudomonas paraeruginosa]|uniref:pirin family protein n=1 Tax=Pseudomonas paraeruginosa TaxID=2994495 RepID=UPI0039FDC343